MSGRGIAANLAAMLLDLVQRLVDKTRLQSFDDRAQVKMPGILQTKDPH